MDGQTYATASIYNPNTYWTPEESERIRNQRIQISNDLGDYLRRDLESIERRQPSLDSNNEMERYFTERINQIEDQQIRLFQTTTTITVNPTLWTKIKIFGTGVKLVLKETWKSDPVGVIVVSCLMCVITFIGIMKLFGA
jgi:hypothetical protein